MSVHSAGDLCLDPRNSGAAVEEAKRLLPHFEARILFVCALSSCFEAIVETADLRGRGGCTDSPLSRSSMVSCLDSVPGNDASMLETAARAVHSFLVDDGSALERLLAALCGGGLQFVSSVWVKAAAGFCHHSGSSSVRGSGVIQNDFVDIVVYWLCGHH